MSQLDPQKKKNSSSKPWSRMPENFPMIRSGVDKAAWQPQDVDELGDTLCEFEHRFSRHSTDLGHVTIDRFRIVLKRDAQPAKQKPYRHSPVLKICTEIDKLLLAGILRRSYLNWASPEVVIAKLDGLIRLTSTTKASISEDDSNPSASSGGRSPLRSGELKSVERFFSVCHRRGFNSSHRIMNSKWTVGMDSVMPQGRAFSPAWLQSIMLRFCEGLEQWNCSSTISFASPRTANSMCATCDSSSNG